MDNIKHIGTAHKYCVVEHAGTKDEEVVISFPNFMDACRWATNKASAGRDLDVMKLGDDGYLTTEF